MNKTLVIVESPAKAKTIGKYLGPHYRVEASMGHIRDLPKSKLGIDIEDNFKPQYITIRGKGELIDNLKKKAKKSSRVLLATDPDREGEAISWHLSKVLDIKEDNKCRIEFHEITKNAIKNAIKNPRGINENLVNSQQARRILDRLVGYLISPLLWKNVKYGLSAGRVQSVAVRIICDRENEIKKFIPQEYWTIHSILEDDKKHKFEAKFYGDQQVKIEIKNEQQADKILDYIKNKDFIVDSVKKGVKKRNPVLPFTTSSMQQEASKRLGFSSKKTMLIAQQLYEGIDLTDEGTQGLITYLRTDSTRISDEAKADALDYIKEKYGAEYTLNKSIKVKAAGRIQDAHEAIRPTAITRKPDDIKESLNKDQYKLYRLIWLRFLASQMAPAVYDTINVDINAGKYVFKASGSILKFKGFMAVYIEDADVEENNENDIPPLVVGQKLGLVDIKKLQHFTQPPPRYTEALLIKTLEEKGIGRPSTYATIISTIQDRGYVVKEQKILKPTELGFIVNNLLNDYFKDIVNIKFTANMENNLDSIEKGGISWVDIIKEFYKDFDKELKYAQENIKPYVIQDEVTDIKCEFCGRNMVIKQGRFGKFLACPGYPECKNTKPIREEAGVLCPLCGGKVLIKKTRKGRIYYGCENNPKCGFMSWDKPTGEYCPKCGSYLVQKTVKGNTIIKCSNKECGFSKDI